MSDFLTLAIAIFYLLMGWYCVQKPAAVASFVHTFFANARGNPDKNWQPSSGMIWFIRILGVMCLFNFAMQIFMLQNATNSG